jgi:hypothetical protein
MPAWLKSMPGFDYQRYLASKRTVEARALNGFVWDQLLSTLKGTSDQPIRMLELGGGIGSMALRLLENLRTLDIRYTLVDASQASLERAQLDLRESKSHWTFEFVCSDLYDFLNQRPEEKWDLLIGHAILDLLDISTAISRFFVPLSAGGYFYFPINYDGLTIFQPEYDPVFERDLLAAYHLSMGQRVIDGKPSGDHQAGRNLISVLQRHGAKILAAGSSDWVVYPTPEGYIADEAYFLECILQIIEDELRNAKDLDQVRLSEWTHFRRAQLKRGELIFIAHQLDFFGTVPG